MKIPSSKFQIPNKKRRGITLVELLIYLTITIIILVVIIDLVTRIGQSHQASAGQDEVITNGRFIIDRITYATRMASTIEGDYPANNLNLVINGQTSNFTLNNSRLYYQEGISPSQFISDSNVIISPINQGENIFYKNINGQAVTIQVKMKISFLDNNFSRNFQTTMLVRGK